MSSEVTGRSNYDPYKYLNQSLADQKKKEADSAKIAGTLGALASGLAPLLLYLSNKNNAPGAITAPTIRQPLTPMAGPSRSVFTVPADTLASDGDTIPLTRAEYRVVSFGAGDQMTNPNPPANGTPVPDKMEETATGIYSDADQNSNRLYVPSAFPTYVDEGYADSLDRPGNPTAPYEITASEIRCYFNTTGRSTAYARYYNNSISACDWAFLSAEQKTTIDATSITLDIDASGVYHLKTTGFSASTADHADRKYYVGYSDGSGFHVTKVINNIAGMADITLEADCTLPAGGTWEIRMEENLSIAEDGSSYTVLSEPLSLASAISTFNSNYLTLERSITGKIEITETPQENGGVWDLTLTDWTEVGKPTGVTRTYYLSVDGTEYPYGTLAVLTADLDSRALTTKNIKDQNIQIWYEDSVPTIDGSAPNVIESVARVTLDGTFGDTTVPATFVGKLNALTIPDNVNQTKYTYSFVVEDIKAKPDNANRTFYITYTGLQTPLAYDHLPSAEEINIALDGVNPFVTSPTIYYIDRYTADGADDQHSDNIVFSAGTTAMEQIAKNWPDRNILAGDSVNSLTGTYSRYIEGSSGSTVSLQITSVTFKTARDSKLGPYVWSGDNKPLGRAKKIGDNLYTIDIPSGVNQIYVNTAECGATTMSITYQDGTTKEFALADNTNKKVHDMLNATWIPQARTEARERVQTFKIPPEINEEEKITSLIQRADTLSAMKKVSVAIKDRDNTYEITYSPETSFADLKQQLQERAVITTKEDLAAITAAREKLSEAAFAEIFEPVENGYILAPGVTLDKIDTIFITSTKIIDGAAPQTEQNDTKKYNAELDKIHQQVLGVYRKVPAANFDEIVLEELIVTGETTVPGRYFDITGMPYFDQSNLRLGGRLSGSAEIPISLKNDMTLAFGGQFLEADIFSYLEKQDIDKDIYFKIVPTLYARLSAPRWNVAVGGLAEFSNHVFDGTFNPNPYDPLSRVGATIEGEKRFGGTDINIVTTGLGVKWLRDNVNQLSYLQPETKVGIMRYLGKFDAEIKYTPRILLDATDASDLKNASATVKMAIRSSGLYFKPGLHFNTDELGWTAKLGFLDTADNFQFQLSPTAILNIGATGSLSNQWQDGQLSWSAGGNVGLQLPFGTIGLTYEQSPESRVFGLSYKYGY